MNIHTLADNDAVKAAPLAGVGALKLWGVSLSDWYLILAIGYTVFLIIDKLPAVYARLLAARAWLKEKYGRKP